MAIEVSTNNQQVDYIIKDYNSTVDGLINFATVNYGANTSANRLWTNFNASSFSRTWLELVSYVSDLLYFYLDTQATQAYLQTATVSSAIKNIAKQFGFTPATAASASGVVTFTTTQAGTISRGFIVRASTGSQFYLTNSIVASAAGNYDGTVLEGRIASEQFTAQGLQNEEFNLAALNIIRDTTNSNPLDISPQVTVSGNAYTLVDTFILSDGTDLPPVVDSLGEVIGGGGRVFALEERPNGNNFLRFGDGIFGRKLLPGEIVSVTYRTGGGTAGNIPAQAITSANTSNPIVASVINNAAFSGGTDEQSIEQLRQLIPASLRTLDRAVAETDYSDLLLITFPEIVAASTERNTNDPGIDLNIYVVPSGIGITKITDNPNLRTTLTNFLERRKMVTVQFNITDAFGVDVLLGLNVYLASNASKATVTAAIISALDGYFNLLTGGKSGAGLDFAQEILTEDLTALLETVAGIDRFEFTKHSYRPRVQDTVLGLTTSYTNSLVEIFPNVSESEWLLGASGVTTTVSGTVLFSNTGLTAFTYTSLSGLIQYSTLVDLGGVAPGDQFRDGAGTDFTVLSVDIENYRLYLTPGLTINNTVNDSNDGSIRTGALTSESFKAFKKINATATNLAVDSITDSSLNLAFKTGTATALSARVLLDNTQVFVMNQFATGDFYLVDSSNNIWDILSNTSNQIRTGITAVNDASITAVASGAYKIVRKLVGYEILFNGSTFTVQYNSDITLYSVGSQFSNIGTIGDSFQISAEQTNVGTLGIAADLVSNSSGTLLLNNSPDLLGVSSDWNLIDSSGQVFNIIGVDNRPLPTVEYAEINQDTSFSLTSSGLGVQYAQGFEVPSTNVYSVVSFNLEKAGNALGNLIVKIVADDGTGLPDLGTVIAVCNPVSLSSISTLQDFATSTSAPITGLDKVIATFTTPPTLTAATQYHLVVSGDATYLISQSDGTKSFSNSGSVAYTYDNMDGTIAFASTVNLSAVQPGHYFRDGSGALYIIQGVSDALDTITLAPSLSIIVTINTDSGSVYKRDTVFVAADQSTPSYADGKASRFDGALWANDTQGPVLNQFSSATDFMFTVEGPKSITIDSNLSPVLGPGATISKRYYDDNNEISLILGITAGIVLSASDVNALGRGTVNATPNSRVDNFVFRTSRYNDDIVNLRKNEIPEFSSSNLTLQLFGGIE
jgi:hypothetical protein